MSGKTDEQAFPWGEEERRLLAQHERIFSSWRDVILPPLLRLHGVDKSERALEEAAVRILYAWNRGVHYDRNRGHKSGIKKSARLLEKLHKQLGEVWSIVQALPKEAFEELEHMYFPIHKPGEQRRVKDPGVVGGMTDLEMEIITMADAVRRAHKEVVSLPETTVGRRKKYVTMYVTDAALDAFEELTGSAATLGSDPSLGGTQGQAVKLVEDLFKELRVSGNAAHQVREALKRRRQLHK